jgi:hypothetical protein
MRNVLCSLCLFFLTGIAFGQAGAGTITGTTIDETGSAVPGAAIEAKNAFTGIVYSATSTNTGNYTISQLPPGTYELSVKMRGFKTFIHDNLTIQAAGIVREDVSLQVGNVSDSVTVSAEASLLKTESGELAHNITVDALDNLPILGIGGTNAGSSGIRNPFNLMTLIPGTGYQANSTIIVNGAPNNTLAMRIEGMDMTNHYVSFAQQEMQPSADSIEEVAVQTSNYAAEFGTAGGGLLNITMKSGTNLYHGGFYDYFVNEFLNAGYPFTQNVDGGKYRPRNRRNDYGGTLGGPIIIPKVYNGHNRTFFFFNWEEFLESSNITFNTTMPTAAYAGGNFSAISPNGTCSQCAQLGIPTRILATDPLGNAIYANEIYDPLTRNLAANTASPFLNNVIPTVRIDPVALKVMQLLPAVTNGNITNNGSGTNLSQRTTVIPSLKLDHSIGSKSKLSFYWSRTATDSQYSTPNGNADGLSPMITQARGTFFHYKVFRLNYDYTLTPTLLLHFGGGYNQINAFDDAPYLNFNAQQQLGLSGFLQNRNFPNFTGAVSTSLGGMQSIGTVGQIQAHTFQQKPGFNSNATWVRGSHTYKAGAEVYLQGTVSQPFAGVLFPTGTGPTSLPYNPPAGLAGQTMGFGFASFLLGDYTSIQQNAPADYHLGKQQWAVFLQDSWKVRRKLTIDYGVRWDYGTYASETYGRAAALGTNVPNPSAGGRLGATIYGATCNCSFAHNYPYAIGPRIGAAYQLNPKTVLRGGWGLVYGFVPDLGIAPPLAGVNQPGGINPFVNIETPGVIPQPVFPNFNPGVYPTVPGSINSAPTAVDLNAGRPPRQNQWSVGIQRELSGNLVLEAAYVGNRGAWWTGAGPNLGLLEQISPATFAAYGLHPYTNAADNQFLSNLNTSAPVVARFGHALLPYSGFSGTVLQALEAYPQFATAGFFGSTYAVSNAPTGNTYYDSMQAKVTKRLSHGLQATGTFTWSKSQISTREDFWNPGSSTKTLQATDQPFLFNANFVYTTPKPKIENKFVNWAIRDWQVGMFLQYGSGFPLTPPSSTAVNNLTAVNGATNYQIPTGQAYFNKDLNCHCVNPYTDQVLNPAAWTNPAAGTWGYNALYGNFRQQRRPQENLNIGRNIRIKEHMNLQLRAEFVNIFNRTYLGNPSTSLPAFAPVKNGQGQYTSGFGIINATAAVGTATTNPGIPTGILTNILPRTGTLIARFSF